MGPHVAVRVPPPNSKMSYFTEHFWVSLDPHPWVPPTHRASLQSGPPHPWEGRFVAVGNFARPDAFVNVAN